MLQKAYILLGTAVCLTYMAVVTFGWEFPSGKRDTLPSSVRQTPGGFRSFHFWHTGFHGGK